MNTTGDQQLVKRINRSVLLRLLRKQDGLSRAQLAKESGLTKSTVSLLVQGLQQDGWLIEGDAASEKRLGRPSTPLHIDTTRKGLIGVEVAVDTLRVVGVSLTGEALCAIDEPLVDTSPRATCKQAAKLVKRISADLAGRGLQLHGLGVGLPGAFDEATGILTFAPNLGWRNVDFVPLMTSALAKAGVPAVPVHVQNEADTAALSEYEFTNHELDNGAANDSLIFVTCGVGVGAGIVLNDRLFTGVQGMAGEIGHSILQLGGTLCSCGRRGCAETFFGERVLGKLKNPAEGGQYLGLVLHNLWTTFNPGAIVVGGSSCARYPAIVEVAQKTLEGYAKSAAIAPAPKVRTASYGLLASAVGAAALVLHHELRPMHGRN